jgi:hypothetical protein
MSMNTSITRFIGIVAVVATTLASVVAAQQKADPAMATKPGVVVADLTELTATVDAVDYSKRLVTLTGPQGNTVTVKAGPEVRNLDQVKVGDQLVVQHYESVALFVRKSGEPPAATDVAAVALAPKGQEPGGIAVDTVEITATVEAIDYAKRTVTLKGPEGKTQTIKKVDPSVERFREIKTGDEVVVRHTEALAISVGKP